MWALHHVSTMEEVSPEWRLRKMMLIITPLCFKQDNINLPVQVASIFLLHTEGRQQCKDKPEKQWALRECVAAEQQPGGKKTQELCSLEDSPWNSVCSFLWQQPSVPWHIRVWLATGSDGCRRQRGSWRGTTFNRAAEHDTFFVCFRA